MKTGRVTPTAFTLRRRVASRSAICLAIGAAWTTPLWSQEIPVDRWLVTGAAPTSQNPLGGAGGPLFPDRNLEVGPGTWTLVREGGRGRFDFSSAVTDGESAFAHVYVRAPEDMSVRLSLSVDSCASLSGWLNGQPLPDPSHPLDVRLAGGWNALLAVIDGDSSCPRAISAELSAPSGPQTRGRSSPGVSALRIQASRPPGARPNHPEGLVTIAGPSVAGLSWSPDRNDLDGTVRFSITAWGRNGSLDEHVDERPVGPPEIDLNGEWTVTVFGPTGIQRMTADLSMADDGTLTGDMRRAESEDERGRRRGGLEGEIRDGWVSGDRFGWLLRTSEARQRLDLEFAGTLRAGELRGTIDFGGFRDFESRFEGRRSDVQEEGGEGERPSPEGDPRPDDGTATEIDRAGTDPDPSATPTGSDALAPPPDPDGQRAQMIRQLLGAPTPRAAAPPTGSVELRIAGEKIMGAADQLVPGSPHEFEGRVPFRKLRDAALRSNGVQGQVRWDEDKFDLAGSLAPSYVLEAFHAPIELTQLLDRGDGVLAAAFQIPDALAGFTLRGLPGEWWVDGAPVSDGLICERCERGRRLEIGFRRTEASPAQVQIADPGYPGAGEAAPPAAEWLKALEGDNRKYRELSDRR